MAQQAQIEDRGYPWLIISAGCLIILMTLGPRAGMGFFQVPILSDTGWSRADFGLAIAIQNLMWGVGQPFFGAIADRYGTWRVLLMSGLLYAAGLLMMSMPESIWFLHMGGGVLVGLGIAAGSFAVIFAAFARNVSAEQRSFAFGMATAAGSAGMFVFAPISQGLIDAFGWSDALLVMSALMLLIPIFGVALRGNSTSGKQTEDAFEQTVGEALREAFAHRSYLLLSAGYFVCGFQVAFITAHFPAYINDIGIDARFAVLALAAIGFFNVIGSLAAGIIGQRYSKPLFLAWIYITRSIVVTIFLLTPQTGTSVMIFACVMGLLWLSTVPPTNALVAIMFGTRHLGLLGGIVFFTHQVGSFLGVWLGGYMYEVFGSFDPVWWLGVALGIFAAIVHWPIQERPVDRPHAVPAE